MSRGRFILEQSAVWTSFQVISWTPGGWTLSLRPHYPIWQCIWSHWQPKSGNKPSSIRTITTWNVLANFCSLLHLSLFAEKGLSVMLCTLAWTPDLSASLLNTFHDMNEVFRLQTFVVFARNVISTWQYQWKGTSTAIIWCPTCVGIDR